MDYKSNIKRYGILTLSLSLFFYIFRYVPHPPNFTPITAVALFSIINFKNKYIGLAIPLICLIVSDLILGISLINLFVYLSFILISGIGLIFGKINFKSILISSLIFFVVSNFGVLIIGYPKTLEGFISWTTAITDNDN